MTTMNGSNQSASKPAHEATTPSEVKSVDDDSPLPVQLAAMDAMYAEVRKKVVDASSQLYAASTVQWLSMFADVVSLCASDPERALPPAQIRKLHSEPMAPTKRRKRRRLKSLAPSSPNVFHHLGGLVREGHIWYPAQAITEESNHDELLRGLHNLQAFLRSIAADKPERTAHVVREVARIVALTLGSTRTTDIVGGGNFLASYRALRGWDILKMPRAPAPNLQLPAPSAPIFDVHAILDTGQLLASHVTHLVATGQYDEFVEQLRQSTAGEPAVFEEAMEALAFSKGCLVDLSEGDLDNSSLVNFCQPRQPDGHSAKKSETD